jgi:uncharacterized protein (DUF427 family)
MKKLEMPEPGPGQESVWDYPRPPKLELANKHLQVIFNGELLAETYRAKRVLETSHPPVYYFPPEDIKMECLKPSEGRSWCEWKGQASYFDVVIRDKLAKQAAWTYVKPTPSFKEIKDHVAFYPWSMDKCFVDGELVRPQPGNFYGGWITNDILGPFKGEPGTSGW